MKKITPAPAELDLIDNIENLMSQPAQPVTKLSHGSLFNYCPVAKRDQLPKFDVPSISIKS